MRRNLVRQLLFAAIGGAALAVAAIVIAGYIKFNVIADDVFLDGTAVAPADVVARWVEPVPGQEDAVQGFDLHADGTARAVNMATLVYTHWRLKDAALVLEGRSIGNGTTSDVTEVLPIVTVGAHEMTVIGANDRRRTYHRRPLPGASASGEPSPACRPADVARGDVQLGDWTVRADAIDAVQWRHGAGQGGQILLTLTATGADVLEQVTAAALDQPLPLVIAGEELSAPVVREKISSGRIMIAVDAGADKVRALATVIAPPCP